MGVTGNWEAPIFRENSKSGMSAVEIQALVQVQYLNSNQYRYAAGYRAVITCTGHSDAGCGATSVLPRVIFQVDC